VAALARERDRLVPHVIARLQREMQQLPSAQLGRWNVFAADGSDAACPRTRANQQAMSGVGKPDGMPQLLVTTVYQLRLGLPWTFRVGPTTESERGHLREMLPELPDRSLLVVDAGFIGYDLCREMIENKRHFLMRVGGNVHLLSELGYAFEVRDQTVYLWPDEQSRRNQPPIALRLIVVRKEGKQPIYLVTSVLDLNCLTDEEAAEIYYQRWEIEVFHRTIKQTLQHQIMRSRTPANCYQEMTWAMLGAWLLGLMTIRHVVADGHDRHDASPAQARNVVRRMLHGHSPCPHTRRSLACVLSACRKDHYHRRGPKASRGYPRKKQHKPPKPPNIKLPSAQQLQKAQPLTPIMLVE